MPAITIGRQFGAGGEPVGRIVARRLKADLLDNEIMTEVARRLELPTDEVEAQDENPGSFLNRLLTALGSASVDFSVPPEVAAWTPPYADPAFDPRKAILNITQQVIREAARTGNVVIVGRGAGYLLRDQPDVTSVFLHAAENVRLRYAMEALGLDEDAARKRMKQTDANRAAYVRQVYGHDWLHPAHYDLVLDSGRLGHETCAEIILAAAKHRAG
jgi:cytidylate kinase